MRLRYLVAPLAVAACLALAVSAQAQQGPPGSTPTSGSVLVGGLMGTQGAAVGPDGWLYITEGGTGGDEDITPPDAPDGMTVTFGLTGSVSRIDPATGAKETVVEGLPSFGFGDEGAGGLADVAFIGQRMYVLLTASPGETGDVDYPNGVYRIDDDGTASLFADITKFNNDNPVDFPDAAPGGNPFALEARGSTLFVTDGNYNRVIRVNGKDDLDLVAQFDNVVPTGLDVKGSGPLLMTQFSPAPHNVGTSGVTTVQLPSGTNTTVLSDTYTQLIDVERAPNGKTYILQFGDQALDENAPPPPGRLLLWENNELLPLVEGIMAGTSLDFAGDTALITTLFGEVVKIENVSDLEPIGTPPPATPPAGSPTAPPVATPTRPGGITAPDTGSGGYADSDGSSPWAMVALAIAAVAVAGAGVAATRRG